jgi:hypothetical protein
MNQAKPIESKDYGVRAKQGKGKKVSEPVKSKTAKKKKSKSY